MVVNLTPSATDSSETHAKHAALVADEKREIRALDDAELHAYRVQTDRAIRNWEVDGNAHPRNDWVKQWMMLRLTVIDEQIAWRKASAMRGGAAFETRGWSEYVDAIRERVNLPVIMMLQGVHVEEKRGSEWLGCCPFHNDRHPSMSVNTEKKVWTCYSCHVGGDVFTFLEMRRGMDFPEAVRYLSEHYRVQAPERPTWKPKFPTVEVLDVGR